MRWYVATLLAAVALVGLVCWPGDPTAARRTLREAIEASGSTRQSVARTSVDDQSREASAVFVRPLPYLGERLALEELQEDPNRVPGPPVRVRGIVVHDGLPLGDVTVRLCRAYPSARGEGWPLTCPRPAALATTRTDAQGGFELATTRRTRLVVNVAPDTMALQSALVFIPLEGDPPPVRIELQAGLPLIVRVVEPDGTPVDDAPVTAMLAGGPRALPGLRDSPFLEDRARYIATPPRAKTLHTDETGRVIFAHVRRGPLEVIAAGMRDFLVVPTRTEVVFVREPVGYVEGTLPRAGMLHLETVTQDGRTGVASVRTDATGHFRIAIAPGGLGAAFIDGIGPVEVPALVVRPGAIVSWSPTLPVRRITGIVRTESGAPLPHARVLLRDGAGAGVVAATWSDATGRFAFDGWERDPDRIRVEAYGLFGEVDVADVVEIEARPCARVLGRVVGGRPRSIALRAGDFLRVTFVDASGSFAFDHVPPLKGARVGGSARFDIPAGTAVHVDVPDVPTCLVEGVVRDNAGNPVGEAVVFATYDPYWRMEMKMTHLSSRQMALTDSAGRFKLRMVMRGPWRGMVVVRSLDHAPARSGWFDPIAGGHVEVSITLPSGAGVHGWALDGRGRPLRNAYVRIKPMKVKGSAWPETLFTDADGRFRFAHIAAGTYWLTLSRSGGSAIVVQTVRTGSLPVELRPTHDGWIEGMVVDGGGRPVGGVMVWVGSIVVEPGADGRFRVGHLAPGAYEVGASRSIWKDGEPASETIRVAAVPTGTKDLRLRFR